MSDKLPVVGVLLFLGLLLILSGSVAAFLAWRLVGVLDLPAPYGAIGTGTLYAYVALTVVGMVTPRIVHGGVAMDIIARLAKLNLGLLSVVLTGVFLRDLVWLGWDLLSSIPALAACSGARVQKFRSCPPYGAPPPCRCVG